MKQKRWPILALIAALMAVIVVAVILVPRARGQGYSLGRYLCADNGSSLLVSRKSAIELVDTTDKQLFDGLEDGDYLLVLHGAVKETFPGRTGASGVWKLLDGSKEDVPQSVRDRLLESGWLTA